MFKKLLSSIFFLLSITSVVASTWLYFNYQNGVQIKQVLTTQEDPYAYFLVNIVGEVKNPGVYKVPPGTIYSEAIAIAGGFADKVDNGLVQENINLAQKVKDGEKITIPSIKSAVASSNTSTNNNSSKKINLNTATEKELDSLPGVGVVTAQKIIEARPFQDIESLKDINGISDAKYSELQDLVEI